MSYAVVDVFAGPGGLGEGFASFTDNNGRYRFKNALSIEKDATAYQTLLLRNFYRQFNGREVPASYWQYLKGDISKERLYQLHPKQASAAADETLCAVLGEQGSHARIKSLISDRLKGAIKWVLVGGPPCQAYSLVGRSRMKTTNPDFEDDERHFLYKEYLRILADHRPPVFVMENVKGLLSATHAGKSMVERILSDLRNPAKALKRSGLSRGYKLYSLTADVGDEDQVPEAFLVKAEEYGIPQARHRILILGVREDISAKPGKLTPRKAPSVEDVIGDLPRIRSTISRRGDSLDAWKSILESCQHDKWYTAGRLNGLADIISLIDLTIRNVNGSSLSSGVEVVYSNRRPRMYADWYRAGCSGIVESHIARSHMASDLHRYLFASSYALVKGKSPKLGDFPKALLPDHKNVSGDLTGVSFADRFRVQIGSRPSTTITSHISKDGHYFIHYDPTQCRSLTIREAARLQTFPDSYKFEGNRTSQYHQVGNAVPPLLSMQIAEIVHDILKRVKI